MTEDAISPLRQRLIEDYRNASPSHSRFLPTNGGTVNRVDCLNNTL
jgi:hypothetical protein